MPPFSHVPVLADAVLDAARQIPRPDGLLIDATLGGGGHSALLLEQHPGLRLIGLDQDATARAAAAERRPSVSGAREVMLVTIRVCNSELHACDSNVTSPRSDPLRAEPAY